MKNLDQKNGLRLVSEIDSDSISANRMKASTMLSGKIKGAIDFVWLLENDNPDENDTSNTYFALSYSSLDRGSENQDSFLRSQFVKASIGPTREYFFNRNKEFLEKATLMLLKKGGFSANYHIIHRPIFDVILEDDNNSELYQKPLGWVAIVIDQTVVIGNAEEDVFDEFVQQLAIAIRQGRDNRRLNAIEAIHRKLAKSKTIAAALESTGELLKDYCSMSEFYFFTSPSNRKILGDYFLKNGGQAREGTYSRKRGELFDALSRYDRFLDVSKRLESRKYNAFKFDNGGNFSIDSLNKISRITEKRDILYVPLVEQGLEISEHPIKPIKNVQSYFKKKQVASHEIFLSTKNTPLFLAGTISSTDVKVATSVARAFQGYLSASIYEEKFAQISKFFQSASLDIEIQTSDFLEFVDSNLLTTRNIYFLEYKADAFGEAFDVKSLRKDSLPTDYLESLIKYVQNQKVDNVHSIKPALDGLRVGANLKFADRVFLEFHILNEFSSSRLLIVELENSELTVNDFRILKHLVGELEFYLKNRDGLVSRLGDLAQIRHAIIAPLSAANSEIISFQKVLAARRHTEKQWTALYKRKHFWDGLDLAIDLGSIAKILAESGRFLFADLKHADLDIKAFNMDKLLDLVINTFESRRKLDNFILKRSHTGNITKQNGDFALLYVALVNLIDNAIKYSIRSEAVPFYRRKFPSLDLGEKFVVEISIHHDENSYQFNVSNVGRYLPPESKKVIFQEFGRGKQRSNLNLKHGTGIGLAAAKQILMAHKETAEPDFISREFTNSPKIGYTTFFFKMPKLIGDKQ